MKDFSLLRQDIFAWSLAVIHPALWVGLFLYFPRPVACAIYLFVALIWTLLDRANLMKLARPRPSALWFWFPGVYLRQRDQLQGRAWYLLFTWLLCTALSFVAINQLQQRAVTDHLAQNACTLVTRILQDEGSSEHCIRITDLVENVNGRFWHAQALLNTGYKEPVTIERRGRNIYVVLPEMEE